MRLAEAAERSFARHETFHPRYSWFRKAYSHVATDGGIFSRPDAPVEIGVGKNMVRAIRFWGTAARLIIDHPHNARGREARCVPTRRGRALFGEGGWDPYMEDPGTLWLLHWLLLAPKKSRLPVWWLAFNEFNAVEFAENDLETAVSVLLDAVPEWHKPHPKSISKDETSRTTVMGQAASLVGEVLDPDVRAFILALANDTVESNTDWVKAVATVVVAKKAPAEWTDEDLLRFWSELHEKFTSFHRLLALHHERRALSSEPFDAFRWTVTRSDGKEQPLLVSDDHPSMPDAERALEELTRIAGSQQQAHRALLAALGKQLLPKACPGRGASNVLDVLDTDAGYG